jgi:hypothetical protein
LAHLFDPLLAIQTSMVDPLPHQITAVYGEMLPRSDCAPSSVLPKRSLPYAVGWGVRNGRKPDYPKLAVTVRPATRALLNAFATLENRSAWQTVDDSINQYVEWMPASGRRMVEGLAKRVLAKAEE